MCIIFGHLRILGYNKHPHNFNSKITFYPTVNVPHTEHSLAFSSSTRSILFFPRGLMSLRINAVMMSMPLDSWVAMQFCPKKSHQPSLIACTTNTARAGDPSEQQSPLCHHLVGCPSWKLHTELQAGQEQKTEGILFQAFPLLSHGPAGAPGLRKQEDHS